MKKNNKTKRKSKMAARQERDKFKEKKIEIGDIYKTNDKYMYTVKGTNTRKNKKKEERVRPITVIERKNELVTIARLTTKKNKNNGKSPETISVKPKKSKLIQKSYIKKEKITETTLENKIIKTSNFNPKEKNVSNINNKQMFVDYDGKIDKRVIKKVNKKKS